ncbi:MAG: glycosyltransferase family 2 protein, partial [Actinomycetota bacterium]
ETATACGALVEPVATGRVDLTIAALPKQEAAGGHGFVTGLARSAIHRATGWVPTQPLSGQRCISREAFNAALPLSRGWGVETGMTIDVLTAGYAVQEIPVNLRHRATSNDFAGQVHRAGQYRDVLYAVSTRRLRGVRVPREVIEKAVTGQRAGRPYRVDYM